MQVTAEDRSFAAKVHIDLEPKPEAMNRLLWYSNTELKKQNMMYRDELEKKETALTKARYQLQAKQVEASKFERESETWARRFVYALGVNVALAVVLFAIGAVKAGWVKF